MSEVRKSATLSSMLFALSFIGALLLALSYRVQAQQTGKIPRIGYLVAGSHSSESARVDAFRQGLRELGYIERQNIIIEFRYAEERFDRLPDLAGELVRLPVDIIVTGGNQAITAAKQATATIPIVMGTSGDALRSGFVGSLARPGGNVTGLTLQSPELSGKRLELLMEVVPKLSLVAVLLKAGNPLHTFVWKETQDAAQALKVKLQSVEIREADELESAFSIMTKKRAGALVVPLEPLFNNQRERIVKLAEKNRLPAMYGERLYVEAGGLMAYGASWLTTYRRAATYVDKILKGAKAGDLPIEQPTKFELVINVKAAKQIGVMVPPTVLARADKIIK
jgi:putative ABC transport system substrate-binding protein